MQQKIENFLTKMDELQWFRMVVCFLPGLVFVKLAANSADGSIISWVSTAMLLVGFAIYLSWRKIRVLMMPDIEDEIESENQQDLASPPSAAYTHSDVSGQEQLDMIVQLQKLCGEEMQESLRLISIEIAVNPRLPFSEATSSALARREIFGNIHK